MQCFRYKMHFVWEIHRPTGKSCHQLSVVLVTLLVGFREKLTIYRCSSASFYSVVCAVGLVGNLLVLFFIRVKQERKKSRINFFVLNLAVTDFQFVLTLPFWAVDTALDFSWPFGDAMCKIISSVTVMNMYASVFFLTAMSVTRYWSVASSLKDRTRQKSCSAKWISVVLWVSATIATAPTSIFSTFPDGQYWLAVYHLQKIIFAFVLPMAIVSVSYIMLLRFIRNRSMKTNTKRTSQVTKSVTIVVLSFFLCWMPNHAITFWGVLVKLNAVHWDKSYYIVHTYVFPVTVCLAHANSCLNPVIYCLMREEFRKKLKDLLYALKQTVTMMQFCLLWFLLSMCCCIPGSYH
uniref:Relaxin family peptide receptor 3.3a3 n=1 Tax=Oncorhynchus kisutch TaxID=8019 RepID=A0A8C7IE29_ONCKI